MPNLKINEEAPKTVKVNEEAPKTVKELKKQMAEREKRIATYQTKNPREPKYSAKELFGLNDDNYHSDINPLLSASKIKDFRKDEYYFYRKHILKEVPQKITPALLIGSGVDDWITRSKDYFYSKYTTDKKVAKADPKNKVRLTKHQFKLAESIAKRIEKLSIYLELTKKDTPWKSQLLLCDPQLPQNPYFKGLCGMLDFFLPDPENPIILDLKTTSQINIWSYSKSAERYGYYLSMAMYDHLVRVNYPHLKDKVIKYIHWVVEKDSEGIYKTKLFELPKESVNKAEVRLFNSIRKIINTPKDKWKPKDLKPDFEDPDNVRVLKTFDK